ncbi:hypothetical protein C4588_02980 [Candidatus Parcubacteria bacterium]|nr:MAG: hypothetical protein C4588_02980 [Candidatus Parcubacteria bacterium]
MNLKTILKMAHEVAISKGWWDPPKSFGEQIALFHSELSEALEEFRNGHPIREIYYSFDSEGSKKPEGVSVELADLIIRIADTCAYYEIDLERALREKMRYNTKRPHRHGGKIL